MQSAGCDHITGYNLEIDLNHSAKKVPFSSRAAMSSYDTSFLDVIRT
jgi:hypothetical protein